MVQVLPANPKPMSFFESLVGSAAQQLPEQVDKYFSNLKNQRERKQGTEAATRLTGMDLSGLDPDTQRALLIQNLKQSGESDIQRMKQQQLSQKGQSERFQDEESYGKVKEAFGEKFANIWKAAPTGGKTELLKHGIDAKLRGEDLNKMLQGVEAPEQPMDVEEGQEKKIPQMKNGKIEKDFEWPSFTKRPAGYSPKEWNDEKKSWRKENVPVFQQNKKTLIDSKKDQADFSRLDKLSSKLPEGVGRIIIDPETGEPRPLAQLAGLVSPDVQEFVKIIARFQNRAKDAFGSRVTNFDLVSFMKQFPGLLNTHEGRKRIIDLIGVNNKLDNLYADSLDKVYKKYGLSGIPEEKADELAQSFVREETDSLLNRYGSLQPQGGSNLSGRMVEVMGPDGQTYEVDEEEVEQLPEGFRLI